MGIRESYEKVKCLFALPNWVKVLPQIRHWPPPPMIRMIPVSSPDEEPVKPGNETVPSMLEMCVCQIDFEERSLMTRRLNNCKPKYLRNKNYV